MKTQNEITKDFTDRIEKLESAISSITKTNLKQADKPIISDEIKKIVTQGFITKLYREIK
tara:strand:+ start:40 stop:219 length:180 start_codon:yes stop_codon:yes gene_type:complete